MNDIGADVGDGLVAGIGLEADVVELGAAGF